MTLDSIDLLVDGACYMGCTDERGFLEASSCYLSLPEDNRKVFSTVATSSIVMLSVHS